MEAAMELRHLRYFVAVAEEGSLTLAAEKRLRTAQPSLSRQIRDLEYEVGVALLTRSVHGVELTAAGRAFLDHARLALTQAEAAGEAARRAAQPTRQIFAIGFLTGQEVEWLPRAIIGDYFKRRGIEIMPTLEIDNYAMAISLVASRRGVALLPISAESFLPWSVVSRPLKGEVPTIDLMIGYHKANASPILS